MNLGKLADQKMLDKWQNAIIAMIIADSAADAKQVGKDIFMTNLQSVINDLDVLLTSHKRHSNAQTQKNIDEVE